MRIQWFSDHNDIWKKIVVMLLVVSMMMPVSYSTVVQADSGSVANSVEISQEEGFAGDFVDVPVYVTPEDLIYKYDITIQYDSELLDLVQGNEVTNELSSSSGEDDFLADVSTAGVVKLQATLTDKWITMEKTKVATLHFHIKDDVPATELVLDVTKHDLYEDNAPADPSFGFPGKIIVKAPKYTVIFDSKGGSSVAGIPDVNKGMLINEPSHPTKDGYHFGGWYKDDALTDVWEFSADIVIENLTLHAKWLVDEEKRADIHIGSVSGLPGSTVEVPVTAASTTVGIGSYGMQINFDANALEVSNITGETGDFFESNFNNEAGWLKAAWADRDGGDTQIETGHKMFTVTFRVKNAAAAGDKALTVQTEDVSHFKVTDRLGLEMAKTLVPGKVTVSGAGSNGGNGGTGGNGSTGGSSSGGTSNPTPVTKAPAISGIDVLVNGKAEQAGTVVKSKRENQTVNTIHIDPQRLEEKLAAEDNGAHVTISLKGNQEIVIGQLNAEMVKRMELKQAVIEIRTPQATYTVPARHLKPEAVAHQMGSGIELKDIEVQIEISPTTAEIQMRVEKAAAHNNLTLVAPTFDFTVRALYQDQTIEISKFDDYVQRSIALPEGVDPARITTGVVIDADGTVRHVPTKVSKENNTYYAQINSLTNSTYSVVWHPLEFADVADHWSKVAVNDMGSRLVIEGAGGDMFSPNRDITRAEFAAILIRGLGLAPQQGASSFADVSSSDWYSGVVNTALAYGLIDGYADGTFRPDDRITREQAMVILARAMQTTGMNVQEPNVAMDEVLRPFHDVKQLADWAQSAAVDNVHLGLVTGRSATELAPKQYMTRAEVAAIIQRLLKQSGLI